jgi:hypothetical protein
MVWSIGYCTLYSVSHLLCLTQAQLTLSRALSNNDKNSDLRVYMSGDGSDVYEDTFMNIAKPDGGIFKPTLVLVGTRLGIDKVTPVYWEALQASLKMPQSVGIAGQVKALLQMDILN